MYTQTQTQKHVHTKHTKLPRVLHTDTNRRTHKNKKPTSITSSQESGWPTSSWSTLRSSGLLNTSNHIIDITFAVLFGISIIKSCRHQHFSISACYAQSQGSRSWQPFGEGKNGHTNFSVARICYFRERCVIFARSKSTFMPKVSQNVRKILISQRNRYVRT